LAQELPGALSNGQGDLIKKKHQALVDDMIRIIEEKGWKSEMSRATNPRFVWYFLKAKEWNIGAALEMLRTYITWRNEQNIGAIDFAKVHEELETFKLLALPHAVDKHGNLLCIFKSRKHFPSQSPMTHFVPMVVFIMETFLCSEQKYKGYTIINDMTDVRWGNFDFQILHTMRGLQNCFPLMPYKVLIHNPPYLFKMVWKLASSVLYEHVLNLIEVTQGDDLTKYVDAGNLPAEYGGKLVVNNADWLASIRDMCKN